MSRQRGGGCAARLENRGRKGAAAERTVSGRRGAGPGSRLQTMRRARAMRAAVHDFGSARKSGCTCMVLPFTT